MQESLNSETAEGMPDKMDNSPKKSSRWNRMGGHIGTIIGALGWIIGFTIVCLTTGNTETLAKFFIPAVAVSLGLACFLILISEQALARFGGGAKFHLALHGSLCWALGLLTLLLNHWIAPVIDSSPRMAHTMRDLRAAYRIDDIWVVLLLAAGAVMLGIFTYYVVGDSD